MFAYENSFIINNEYSRSKNIYDSFINAIKELKERIYSNVENILVQKDEPSLDELIGNIKDSFNNTENILFNLDFFKDEYYTILCNYMEILINEGIAKLTGGNYIRYYAKLYFEKLSSHPTITTAWSAPSVPL